MQCCSRKEDSKKIEIESKQPIEIQCKQNRSSVSWCTMCVCVMFSSGQIDPTGAAETVLPSVAGGPAERLHRQPHWQLRLEQQRGPFPLFVSVFMISEMESGSGYASYLADSLTFQSCLEKHTGIHSSEFQTNSWVVMIGIPFLSGGIPAVVMQNKCTTREIRNRHRIWGFDWTWTWALKSRECNLRVTEW